ncbi:DNA repair protein REV1 isoform X4 [Apteryx mantelli]|uniref:DNA repair protein REV1 n=1 Tax=Apteryx mantelli TaxID=2696672 RepID=A0ABM4EDF2_9AVES
MRRGGWRKRAGDGDGWGIWGGYMSAKVKKLDDQFRSDSAVQHQRDGNSSSIFSGVAIYVNGFTDPSADELRRLMMLHGGQYHMYYSRSKTTHIIATNLPNAKIKELKGEKVVRPEWIMESIEAGRLLSHIPYQLYTKQSSVQKGLNFNTICKPEDAVPGPSNIAKDLNRVNHIKKCEIESEITPNGISSWNEEEEESDNFGFMELEQILPERKQNGIQPHKDSTAIFNGHTHISTSALKTQDCLVPSSNSVASRFSPSPVHEEGKTEKGMVDFRDCTTQQMQQSNKNADFSWNPHRTMSNSSSSSSLHSNTKINGAHHSTVQGPSSTKSTSVPTPSKAASSPVSKPSDCSFISDFYSRSRLHHIATWKCELTEFVNSLQRKNSGVFPGREKLKKWKAGRSTFKTDTGNVSLSSLAKPQICIMHVDMDCFFVSVAIRNRPDLKGKPVAVTSNRGAGKAPLRPGANPQLERQYYQNKLLNGKAAEIRVPDKLDSSVWEHPDSTHMNGADMDLTILSMAEIASCSYEARQVGIKNGMFFGQAKKLCPNLQAVSYDFNSYKEVARTVYEILASYTHNIEAVSCDEALVDITEILTETRLTPDEFANAIRTEIKAQTKCTASVGMGSNILLARMATRKAKPDGQYHLKPEEVDDFIRGQLVTSLPGVGRSMESKLVSLGIKTCGDLQCASMSKLQKEFGPKTGQMLYRFCRGLDDRPVRTEKERKSVSAEINYGIRFTQNCDSRPCNGQCKNNWERNSKHVSHNETEHIRYARVFVAAMDLEISSDSRTCTFLPSRGTHLASGLNSNVNKTESAVKWNGLHSPISVKSRLNLSIEVPSASQLDKSVLEALPPDLREQVEQIYTIQQGEAYRDSKKESVNGCNTALLSQPVGTVLLQIPELQEPNADMGINVIALPAFSQVDPEVFAALPAELQAELKDAYDQRQKQSEQQPANTFVSKNPLLHLKHVTMKSKKKIRKKNPVSPVKKIQSPLKNKLLGSPAKNMPAISGSPQKLIDGFLKQEGATTQSEAVPSTSDSSGPSALQTEQPGSFRPQAPNLAGAVEFNDVKTLLKEWITTISDPMEEDILQVVKYCTDLIEEKDLEKLDLVVKYMKRLMQSSVESVWNMAFDFILDNVQVVLQQTYGSTLKVI